MVGNYYKVVKEGEENETPLIFHIKDDDAIKIYEQTLSKSEHLVAVRVVTDALTIQDRILHFVKWADSSVERSQKKNKSLKDLIFAYCFMYDIEE